MTLRLAVVSALAALLAVPVAAQIVVYGALSRDRDVAPGQAYEEVVRLHNPTDQPQQARLFLTDYRFAADGSNVYPDPGISERSNARWITFAPPVLTLPAGETVPVTLTVVVPADLPASGSYWSMLMVEPIARGSAESTLEPEEGEQVRYGVFERVRYGVQIASHVGEAEAVAEVVDVALLDRAEGGRILAAAVTNPGERMIDGPVYVDVFDADGVAVGRIEGSSARIYPGTSFRHRVDLSSLDPGVYEALLVIDGGDAGVFGAQYTLEL